MSGTSGSSSDAALATRYAAEYFCKTWTAPGLNQAEGYKAISDLSHHYFRAEGSSPPPPPIFFVTPCFTEHEDTHLVPDIH